MQELDGELKGSALTDYNFPAHNSKAIFKNHIT